MLRRVNDFELNIYLVLVLMLVVCPENQIRNEGAAALAEMLKLNDSISALYVRGRFFTFPQLRFFLNRPPLPSFLNFQPRVS